MSNELKIIVGAGRTFQADWHALKQSDLDLLDSARWSRMFRPSSIDAILAEHVWEHLKPHEAVIATQNCYRYLKPGGYMRVAVPDGFHPNAKYIEWVRPGGTWNPHDHHVLYNYKLLTRLFESVGFKVRLLEWFDERGKHHRSDWSFQHGNILRCAKHWYATAFLSVVVGAPYTSLVIDAFKR
jgi:predicted SAM-dependent methyltransferase